MRITKARALVLAQKKYGKFAYLREAPRNRGASSPERRAAASKERNALVEPKLPTLGELPDDMLLGEYKRLVAEQAAAHRVWRAERDRLLGACIFKRYSIGDVAHGFGWVRGSGDTWEEALREAGAL